MIEGVEILRAEFQESILGQAGEKESLTEGEATPALPKPNPLGSSVLNAAGGAKQLALM